MHEFLSKYNKVSMAGATYVIPLLHRNTHTMHPFVRLFANFDNYVNIHVCRHNCHVNEFTCVCTYISGVLLL